MITCWSPAGPASSRFHAYRVITIVRPSRLKYAAAGFVAPSLARTMQLYCASGLVGLCASEALAAAAKAKPAAERRFFRDGLELLNTAWFLVLSDVRDDLAHAGQVLILVWFGDGGRLLG
jgi:hypothetical protein